MAEEEAPPVDDEVLKFEREQKKEREMQEREAALFGVTEPIYDSLYGSVTADMVNEVSRNQRQTMLKGSHTSLTYSEISYAGLFKVIGELHRHGLDEGAEGTFVDLGSGVGNLVYGSLLAHDFSVVVGIEILSDLHNIACQVHELWDAEIRKPLPVRKQEAIVKFVKGDCCFIDWSYGDVVFANATCFDRVTMERLARLACDLKPHAFFVSVSNELPASIVAPYMELVLSSSVEASWGTATTHFYRRNNKAGPSKITDRSLYVAQICHYKAIPDGNTE